MDNDQLNYRLDEFFRILTQVVEQGKDNAERLGNIEKDVSEIKSDVKVLKGQFNDVAVMALEDNKRITKLEGEVAELQSNIH